MVQNIALNKYTSASSYVMPYSSSRAVNGTTTPFSRWLCNKLPGWMSVDAGVPFWINRWVVRHMPVAGWKSPDYINSDFSLQGSLDNRNWVTIDSVAGNNSAITDRTVNPLSNFRYFRIYVTKGLRTNPQLASIMELEIYSAPASSLLSNLKLSSGTLIPSFNGTIFSYTASVANSVSVITVTPTALDIHAAIIVNGEMVQSGSPSHPIFLNIGQNIIKVDVYASDSSTMNSYTVTVDRADSNYLSELTAQAGTLNIPLSPSFDKSTAAYTASVDYDVTNITITPTAESDSATITVNGNTVASGEASDPISLNVGNANEIKVVVTAGGVSRTYTLTVTRQSSAYLTGITFKIGRTTFNLNPDFSRTKYNGYSTTVTGSPVSVTPTKEDPNATLYVTCNGTVVQASGGIYSVPVSSGANTLVVKVTSTSGDVKNYTFTIQK